MVALRMVSAVVGDRLWKGFAANWALKGRRSVRTIEYISLSTRQRPCLARSDAETRSHAVSRWLLVKTRAMEGVVGLTSAELEVLLAEEESDLRV